VGRERERGLSWLATSWQRCWGDFGRGTGCSLEQVEGGLVDVDPQSDKVQQFNEFGEGDIALDFGAHLRGGYMR
jgi:hypothetical protein